VLRWPGGCYADIYDWRTGIGPRESRPVTLNRWWGNKEEHNAFGTHETFESARRSAAKAFLTVNVGTGSPREAMRWVEYITSPTNSTLAQERRRNGRAEPWKIDFLGIGNEPKGCGSRMRAEWFADQFRQYVGFIVPPRGATIIASGPDGTDPEWTRTTLELAIEHMDAFSMHYYTLPTGDWENKGPATGFDESQWLATFERTYMIEPMIQEQVAIMDEFDPEGEKALIIGEWGTWYDPTPGSPGGWLQQQNSIRDALVAAVNFGIFHRNARRLRAAGIAQMVNVLQAMLLTDGPKMVRTPTFHAFRMYRPFQGATSLPLELESPAYGGLRAVDGTAARGTDGKLYVGLVNLDPREGKEVTISLRGVEASGVVGEVLTAAAIAAHNTFDAPDAVRPRPFEGARLVDGTLSATLPAKSVVVLALEEVAAGRVVATACPCPAPCRARRRANATARKGRAAGTLAWAPPLPGRERRREHAKAARVRVEFDLGADRHDELVADVADHRAAVRRDPQRPDVVVQDLRQGERAVARARLAIGALAEHEAGDAVEDPGELERGEHPVDPVRRFRDVLEEEDRAVEVRQVGRAGQRTEHGEVAAEQAAARLAAAQGHGAVAARHQLVVVGIAAVGVVHQLAVEEHAPELVGVEPAPAAGADRTVEGDQASAGLDRAMQRGDVGVAEQRLGVGADRVIVEQRQQARGTGAAPGADDGRHRRIGERGVEVAGARRVVARQVAAAVGVVRAGDHAQAQCLHHLAGQLQV